MNRVPRTALMWAWPHQLSSEKPSCRHRHTNNNAWKTTKILLLQCNKLTVEPHNQEVTSLFKKEFNVLIIFLEKKSLVRKNIFLYLTIDINALSKIKSVECLFVSWHFYLSVFSVCSWLCTLKINSSNELTFNLVIASTVACVKVLYTFLWLLIEDFCIKYFKTNNLYDSLLKAFWSIVIHKE